MWKIRIMKTKRANNAVSEIIGVILLLAMAVALFSVVYLFVMHDALDISENSPPSVTVLGTIGGSDIILEHRGGETLSLDTEIMITISGIVYKMTVGDLLDNESKEDGKWSVGEKLSYDPSMDITGRQVEILVIDVKSGSMVMQGTLQEGETSVNPIAITRYATNVVSYSAKLWMDYDFKNYSGYLGFAWKPDGGSWNYSVPPLGSGAVHAGTGSYAETVSGLTPSVLYWFKSQLKYGSTTIEGSMMSFITLGSEMGRWHFNESTGTIAYDSSGRGNDGTLKPDSVNRPQWVTGINESALSFDGIDDYVEVPDDTTLDLTDAISIEAWIKPLENSEGFVGDIKSVIDTSGFGILDAYEPDMVHVSGDIYVIACRSTDNDGFLVTVRIASDGLTKKGYIDILEFAPSYCYEPDITHISGDVYAITYRGPDNDGFIKTVEIASDGRITNIMIDYLEFDTTYGGDSDIIYVSGTIYAIAHTGDNSNGRITTVRIEDNGSIADSILETFDFDIADVGVSEEFNVIHINGDVYAIAYRNPDSDGYLKTIGINSGGNISIIDSYSFDTFDGYSPSIIHVDDTIYAIAYGGFNNSGVLKTVDIANDGHITGTIIDSFKFDTYGKETEIINIKNDVFAISYRGPDNDGFIKTVEIENDGQITDSIIDTLEFGVSRTYYPNIIHINGDVYAIVYRGWDDDGFLATVEMANNGSISDRIINILEFDRFYCYYPHIVHVNGDIYAITYTGYGSDGFLKTIEITNTGAITDSVIDTLEFDTSYGYEPRIIHVNGDIYAIAYTGLGTDGFIKTVEITNTGAITNSVIDSLEFDTSYARYSDIVHVNGTVFAVAYMGPSSDGFIKTVEIANTGAITNSVIDSLEFDTSYCYWPDIICIADAVYAIAYTGPGYDGFLKTLRIGTNGSIVDAIDDSLEFDTSNGCEPSIIHVNGTVYAISYRGPGSDGFMKTIEIDLKGTIRTIVSKDGAYGISANATRVFATINTHTNIISAPISPGFNHIVFNYNKDGSSDQLRLYINGTEMANGTLTETITTNTNNLYFGKVNAIIDEIVIYGTPLAIENVVDHFDLMKP
jgi:flagellin-like protein